MFEIRLAEFMERWTQWTISVWPRGRPFQFHFIVSIYIYSTNKYEKHVQCVSDVCFHFWRENNSVLSCFTYLLRFFFSVVLRYIFEDFISSLCLCLCLSCSYYSLCMPLLVFILSTTCSFLCIVRSIVSLMSKCVAAYALICTVFCISFFFEKKNGHFGKRYNRILANNLENMSVNEYLVKTINIWNSNAIILWFQSVASQLFQMWHSTWMGKHSKIIKILF